MNYRGLGSGIVRALQDGADIEFVNNEDTNTFKAILHRRDLSVEESGKKGGQITDEGGQKSGKKTSEGGKKTNESGQKSGKKTLEGGQITDKGGQKSGKEIERGGKKIQEGGKKTIELLLELIGKNPRITHKELSETIGIVTSAIQKHIENLKAKGIIKRVGPDKGGYWEIIQTND